MWRAWKRIRAAAPSRSASASHASTERNAAASAGGIVDAVTDGETGLLVAPDDPPALAAALRSVLACEALAQRLGAAARVRFQARHTIDHMAVAWRQAWVHACRGGRRRR